ncbi:hypothetical protein FRC07_008602, partial [Ceratobasidium sp. 392]
MSEPDLTRLHALVIGINKYKSGEHPDLEGCISDATSIVNYFKEVHRVPSDNIKTLFNEEATRKGILDAFRRHLIQNEKIDPGDPILVYFSGHGDQQVAPEEWRSSDGKTELILPHDAGPWDEESKPDTSLVFSSSESKLNTRDVNRDTNGHNSNKSYIHGIPDRTLGALVRQLSKAKGDNITVILDSCHSASSTRGQSREQVSHVRARVSHVRNAPPIPADIDEDFGQLSSQVVLSQNEAMNADKQKFGKFEAPSDAPSLETHVLLAACRNHELAQEVPYSISDPDPDADAPQWSGLFTTALLAALRECDLATTSYSALMRLVQRHVATMMQSMSKTYGKEVTIQFALTKGMIHLDRDRYHNTFKIKAGTASGIKKDTELGVYSGNMLDMSELIALLVVTEVTDTEATLRRKEDNPN